MNAADENVGGTVEPVTDLEDLLNPSEKTYTKFQEELEHLINCYSLENGSNTPDFILAEYLVDCLKAFNKCSRAREKWFGKELKV